MLFVWRRGAMISVMKRAHKPLQLPFNFPLTSPFMPNPDASLPNYQPPVLLIDDGVDDGMLTGAARVSTSQGQQPLSSGPNTHLPVPDVRPESRLPGRGE